MKGYAVGLFAHRNRAEPAAALLPTQVQDD